MRKISSLLCIFVVIIISTFPVHRASGLSLNFADCREHLVQSDVVFFGRVVESGKTPKDVYENLKDKKDMCQRKLYVPELYADFEVLSIYKGTPKKIMRVLYRPGFMDDLGLSKEERVAKFIYSVGREQLIFLRQRDGFYERAGFCSPYDGSEIELQAIQAQHKALDALIVEYPNSKEFYLKKIEFYKKYKDVDAAVETYDNLFQKLPEARNHYYMEADITARTDYEQLLSQKDRRGQVCQAW